MKIASLLGVLLPLTMSAATAAEDVVTKELTPTGKLRAGLAYAPVKTPVFVTKDASGQVEGVGLDLAKTLARSLGVEVEVFVAATTGELTDASAAGKIDIGFTPVDDERKQRVDFSPPFFIIESTYLVTAASGISTQADVDRPEVTVAGIAGSTTIRAAGRTLKRAKIVALKSVADAMAMMQAGSAQALALSRDAMPALQKTLPGSRVLDGAYQVTGVAMSVPKNKPAALAFVTRFMEKAKTDGTVRRALDAAGLQDLAVAPSAN
ncbi:MAG: transporter substrate-binding domain-containing protein [Hyphomicrobiales bacterium]|nr:transporter substrate-binding domain-containing protein [Hyphomicrobiales bacterium]